MVTALLFIALFGLVGTLASVSYFSSAGYKARIEIWRAIRMAELAKVKAIHAQDLEQRAVQVRTSTEHYVTLQAKHGNAIDDAVMNHVLTSGKES